MTDVSLCWNMLDEARWWKLLWVYLKGLLLRVGVRVLLHISVRLNCFVGLCVCSRIINVCVWPCMILVKKPPAGCTCVCVCVLLNVCHTSLHLHNSRLGASEQLFSSTPRCEFLTFTRPKGNWEWEHSAQVCYVSPALLFCATPPCFFKVGVCACVPLIHGFFSQSAVRVSVNKYNVAAEPPCSRK